MWRLVYAIKKLKAAEIRKLRTALDNLSFSCGTSLQEADIPLELKTLVYVKSCTAINPLKSCTTQQNLKISAFTVLQLFHLGPQIVNHTIHSVMTA